MLKVCSNNGWTRGKRIYVVPATFIVLMILASLADVVKLQMGPPLTFPAPSTICSRLECVCAFSKISDIGISLKLRYVFYTAPSFGLSILCYTSARVLMPNHVQISARSSAIVSLLSFACLRPCQSVWKSFGAFIFSER